MDKNKQGDTPDEGFFDRLSRVDNILKQKIVPLLEDIGDAADEFQVDIDTDEVIVQDREKVAYNIEFSAMVPPTDSDEYHADPTYRVTREMPVGGFAEELFVYFRQGTNDKVGFTLEREATSDNLFPSNPEAEPYSADGIGHPFNIGFNVDQGEEITAEFVNNNVETERMVTIIMTVVEENGS